jgi:hypothetical protein
MAIKLLVFIQVALVNVTYILVKFFVKPDKYLWVIGVSEVAQNVYRIGRVIHPSVTVALSRRQAFYNYEYDYELGFISNNYIRLIVRFFYGPILLGYLTNKATHFFYISGVGFLVDIEQEYKFLKSKSKKIACMFFGSDIRSPKLVKEYLKKHKIDGFIDYQGIENPELLTDKFDNKRKDLSRIVDKYADIIFNFKYDQLSYIKKHTYPWPYSYDKKNFFYNQNKFDKISKIKILHAPSSHFVKGTPLVRAAIKKLSIEGYIFEYVELQGASNHEVLDELRSAHIVLNQFYGYDISLGLFAVEAMASHTALLMSYEPSLVSDYDIELDGFDSCCFNTKYWEVYDNLKLLLDNPEKIRIYADNGYRFCKKYYTFEAAGSYYHSVFLKNNIIN